MPKLRQHLVPRVLEILQEEVRHGSQPLGLDITNAQSLPEGVLSMKTLARLQNDLFIKHDRMYHHKKVSEPEDVILVLCHSMFSQWTCD